MKTNSVQRESNLELLRIVCMFMIVIAHCIDHGGIVDAATLTGVNREAILLLKAFISVLINCFVLISGYFLSQSKFKLRKWFELWVTTAFWSVLITIICIATGIKPVSLSDIAKSFLPFSQQQYWFVTTYLLMYLLMPFLNAAVQNLDQRQFLTTLLTCFAVFFYCKTLCSGESLPKWAFGIRYSSHSCT